MKKSFLLLKLSNLTDHQAKANLLILLEFLEDQTLYLLLKAFEATITKEQLDLELEQDLSEWRWRFDFAKTIWTILKKWKSNDLRWLWFINPRIWLIQNLKSSFLQNLYGTRYTLKINFDWLLSRGLFERCHEWFNLQ